MLRRCMLFAATLAICGCSSLSKTSIDTLRVIWGGELNELAESQIFQPDADTLVIRAGIGETLFVAPRHSQGCIAWSGLSEQVETCFGRLTQLVGLEAEVAQPLALTDPFRTGLLTVANGEQVTRVVDYPVTYQTGITQIATYFIGPVEPLTLFGQTVMYQRIDEQIHMPELGYSALNQYWVDPETAEIRRSLQHPHPHFPVLEIINPNRDSRGLQK